MKLFLVTKDNGEALVFTDEAVANKNALQTVGGVYLKVNADVEVVQAVDKKAPAKPQDPRAEIAALRAEVEALRGSKARKGK